jgi:hypothetical protein
MPLGNLAPSINSRGKRPIMSGILGSKRPLSPAVHSQASDPDEFVPLPVDQVHVISPPLG